MIRIMMYTKGTGSGHLTRINAVYRGFIRAQIPCEFIASARRSKYKHLLEPGIALCDTMTLPCDIDIFICDWRSDDFTDSLPPNIARLWIGLRRLGTMRSRFPEHYHVVAIEPGVKGDACIWPIISVWEDELLSRDDLVTLLGVSPGASIGLLCENGAYPKHVQAVFTQHLPSGTHLVKCSNSPYSEDTRTLSFYPVARLFKAVDYLVIGGGYNSIHEARCYADLGATTVINVGGDDQALRMSKMSRWEKRTGSQADVLARHIAHLYTALIDS
jgi:hypothetical protein